MTIMCLGRDLALSVGAAVTAVTALTDRSVTWVREDLNCEPSFWARNFRATSATSRAARRKSPRRISRASRRCTITRAAGRRQSLGPATGVRDHVADGLLLQSSRPETSALHRCRANHLAKRCSCPSSRRRQRTPCRGRSLFRRQGPRAEIFLRALGGNMRRCAGRSDRFNPLSLSDSAPNREFLYQLFRLMLRLANGRS